MMKISFMTLGCPQWDLRTVCEKAREFGFDGVDFRGLQDDLDVTVAPAFTTGVKETKKMLDGHGLETSCVSSSIRVCDEGNRQANVDEARRTIPVALALGCKNVRVFGGGNPDETGKEAAADLGRACMEEILQLDGADQLKWLFETHDHWIKAKDCALLLERISNPAFGVLWDMGHTARVGGETPAESFTAVNGRVGYTHIKDAVHEPGHPDAMKDGWRYVDPGTGQLPLAEAIGILKENGYQGWFNFEHEKRWHPELAEPEDIFPKFAAWIKPLLA